jgi:hypothetical protein
LASLHPKPQHQRLGLKPSYQQEINEEEDHRTTSPFHPTCSFLSLSSRKKEGEKLSNQFRRKTKASTNNTRFINTLQQL